MMNPADTNSTFTQTSTSKEKQNLCLLDFKEKTIFWPVAGTADAPVPGQAQTATQFMSAIYQIQAK